MRTKEFERTDVNPSALAQELGQFHEWLTSTEDLPEKDEVLPFFRKRPQLSTWIGAPAPTGGQLDRLAFEYDLFGDFACDLIVGDSRQSAYTLVEFEPATRRIIFEPDRQYVAPWASRFDHGFSQIIDWYWKPEDQRKTEAFCGRFGSDQIAFHAVLVIGRRTFLSERERRRLGWRYQHVTVCSRQIPCLTFGDLYDLLKANFDLSRRDAKPGDTDAP